MLKNCETNWNFPWKYFDKSSTAGCNPSESPRRTCSASQLARETMTSRRSWWRRRRSSNRRRCCPSSPWRHSDTSRIWRRTSRARAVWAFPTSCSRSFPWRESWRRGKRRIFQWGAESSRGSSASWKSSEARRFWSVWWKLFEKYILMQNNSIFRNYIQF